MEKMEKGVLHFEPLAAAAKGAGIGAQYPGIGVGMGAGCAGFGLFLKAVVKVWRP